MLLLMKKITSRNKATTKEEKNIRHGSMTYWPTSIQEVINWFHFMNIVKHNADRIDNQITLLMLMLKMFSMRKVRFWYDNECDDETDVKIIAIMCINCGKQTGLSMDNMNNNY